MQTIKTISSRGKSVDAMNPSTIVLFSLVLLTPAVLGGSTSNVRRRVPNLLPKTSDSSEEFDRYLTDPGKFPATAYVTDSIPSSFDARTKWSRCPSISRVPNQGCCDASFALVPTAVMTDRACIVNNGTDFDYSAYDVVACCESCLDNSWNNKCLGGRAEETWKYWTTRGIASESCLPYKVGEECTRQQPSCPSECKDMGSKHVETDRRGGFYYKVNPTVQDIQQEIMTKGPVEASFPLYLDFAMYDGEGVYKHRDGTLLGTRSVKIVGWGMDGGVNYWLVANTEGAGWGDRGYAKFVRGEDHLGIESNVRAAEFL